jgi:hypothetical protein
MNPKVTRGLKLLLWVGAVSVAALALHGSSGATNLFRPPPPRPSPPGKDEMAVGSFQCGEDPSSATGFTFLIFSGTSGISSPSIGGRFPLDSGSGTPVTCQGLAQQVAADATAGGCTVGPVADVPSDFDAPETTVHFVCSGGHDAVIAAIGQVSSDIAGVTTSTPLD